MESKLKTILADDSDVVEAVLAQVGEGTSDPNEGVSMGSSPHKGRVTVSFVPSNNGMAKAPVASWKTFVKA